MLRLRLLYVAGAVVTLALLGLGAIWPTTFTFAALFALPAPAVFLVAAVIPEVLKNRRKLKIYLIVCIALSALSWSAEIAWFVFT